MKKRLLLAVSLLVLLVPMAQAQDRDGAHSIGIRGGATSYEGDDFGARTRPFGGLFGEFYQTNRLSYELAANVGELAGKGSSTFTSNVTSFSIVSRLALLGGETFRPYIAGGGEAIFANPRDSFDNLVGKSSQTSLGIPVGGGLSLKLSERTNLDFRGLYHIVLSDKLDAVSAGSDDNYVTGTVGLTWVFKQNKDIDNDGLFTKDEKTRGTNPEVADTDGDGLSDGDEVLVHNTDPLAADSDNDGLADGIELSTHGTDPNKADTDADALSDGAEVSKHGTNPLVADSDEDGLDDGSEVNTHSTNPANPDTDADGLTDADELRQYNTKPTVADSDADGLSDGQEINQHKTDPLVADSDGGSVADGDEVARGTNPMMSGDDVILEIKEAGAPIVLDGVVFGSGSSKLSDQSKDILVKALNTMKAYPEMNVEIHGFTDNTGRRQSNVRLSEARAASVKAYLVSQGVAAGRVTARGFGPEKPIAPNSSKEGRQQNRRIEFMVAK